MLPALPLVALHLGLVLHDEVRSLLASTADRLALANRTTDAMCPGQRRAFQHAHKHFVEEQTGSIVHIGGSVAAGTGCSQHGFGEARACSYGARFAASLARDLGLPTKSILYINHAVGGSTTGSAIPQLPFLVSAGLDAGSSSHALKAADLILIDFAVNDWQTLQDWSGQEEQIQVHGRGGAKLTANASASAMRAYEDVGAATEVMLQYLLSRYPSSALWMVQLSCCLPPTCSGSDVARYTAATRAHRDVASAYGVALWHFEDHLDGACDERAYDLVGHPRWPTHALVAEALFASWGAMQARIEDLDGRHAAVRGGAAAGYAARSTAGHLQLLSADSASSGEGSIGSASLAPCTPGAHHGATIFDDRARDRFAVCEAPLAVYEALMAWAHSNASSSSWSDLRAEPSLLSPLVKRGHGGGGAGSSEASSLHAYAHHGASLFPTGGGGAGSSEASSVTSPGPRTSVIRNGIQNGIHVTFGTWALYADRPEKPGWITSGTASVIEFELRFGGSPRLTIIYERSYEGFGSVAVQLLRREADGGNAQVLNGQVLLDGLHRDTRNVTLTEVATLNVKMPAMARFPGGFGVRPHTSDLLARLTFRPRGTGSKFKLRYVGSC